MTTPKEEGFVLLESIVALSILALFVGAVFPFFIELFHVRDQAKTRVESTRFLYESALYWDRTSEKEEAFYSNGVHGQSLQHSDSITILLEGREYISTKIQSIEWAD